MTPIVKLDPATLTELRIVKLQLDQQSGKTHTLDDDVHWLIENAKGPRFNDRVKATSDAFGSIKDLGITIEDLQQIRKEKFSRIVDF
jgi:hypothetical protein